jgi:hypothetical protein
MRVLAASFEILLLMAAAEGIGLARVIRRHRDSATVQTSTVPCKYCRRRNHCWVVPCVSTIECEQAYGLREHYSDRESDIADWFYASRLRPGSGI